MAINNNNILLMGLSGSIGDQLTIRQVNGKTIVGRKRGKSTTPPTRKQTAVLERFKIATKLATAAWKEPEKKAIYQEIAKKRKKNAYTLLCKDAHSIPEIRDIFTDHYKGEVGNVIYIQARDVVQLDSVEVMIIAADNTVLETGRAIAQSTEWAYTCKAANNSLPGTRIVIAANDIPGNQITRDFLLI